MRYLRTGKTSCEGNESLRDNLFLSFTDNCGQTWKGFEQVSQVGADPETSSKKLNPCNLGALLCLAEEDVACIVCEQIVTTEYTEFVAYISPPCETIHQVLTKFCVCRT